MFTDRSGSSGGPRRLLAVVGAVALIVSACGGSTATPSPTAATSPMKVELKLISPIRSVMARAVRGTSERRVGLRPTTTKSLAWVLR